MKSKAEVAKQNNICFSFNYAPHYREEIYLLMDKEFNADFYFGSKTLSGVIKKIEYNKFKGFVAELTFKLFFHNFYFLKGQSKLSKKSYKKYIITGQPYNLSGWLLLIKNKIKGKKTYLWNHGLYGKENSFKLLIMKLQFYFIDGYFLYSNYSKDQMIKKGIDDKKLFVIYNSLKYSESLKIRNKLIKTNIFEDKFKNKLPNIIFIGRLTKVKKLDLLFEAQKLSFKMKKGFNVTLIGDGKIKQELEKIAQESNLESNTWFYGSSYDENKIAEFIFNADVCVSPGNVGLTAIHSLSYGTPVITHNNFSTQMPEFEAVIEKVTGVFFKENNVESLYTVINDWLSENPVKTSGIIENCYKVIDDQYNPFNQIKILQKILI